MLELAGLMSPFEVRLLNFQLIIHEYHFCTNLHQFLVSTFAGHFWWVLTLEESEAYLPPIGVALDRPCVALAGAPQPVLLSPVHLDTRGRNSELPPATA